MATISLLVNCRQRALVVYTRLDVVFRISDLLWGTYRLKARELTSELADMAIGYLLFRSTYTASGPLSPTLSTVDS